MFCVTGFGLAPWRLRDQYFLIDYHFIAEDKYGRTRKLYGLRRLAGQYRTWIRLPGSHTLDELDVKELDSYSEAPRATKRAHRRAVAKESDLRIPLPVDKQPAPPVTGIRASGTSI
jgi:hypothetical protein